MTVLLRKTEKKRVQKKRYGVFSKNGSFCTVCFFSRVVCSRVLSIKLKSGFVGGYIAKHMHTIIFKDVHNLVSYLESFFALKIPSWPCNSFFNHQTSFASVI